MTSTFSTSPETLPLKMNVSINHLLALCVLPERSFRKMDSNHDQSLRHTQTQTHTYTHAHTLLYGSAKVPGAQSLRNAFGRAFWITAVTSLKCLSEGFLRGSGLGQCLHWHLHTSPHRPVWFGHRALAQGGTWAPRRDSQDWAKWWNMIRNIMRCRTVDHE